MKSYRTTMERLQLQHKDIALEEKKGCPTTQGKLPFHQISISTDIQG
jgi:hypothetical protein